jgi:DNA polymerase V
MRLVMKKTDRVILAIDLKSFYASVECLSRDMDPFKTPLVVADADRGDGTIVLAASPFIKEKYGVKSRCRLYDVPKDIPSLIIAKPHMKRYLEVSSDINSIYLDYVSEEDMFVYSIDESFLDVTDYLAIHHDTPSSYARKIIDSIRSKTGLTVTCGIGKNLFMAKAAMDIEAKHKPDFLAQWDYTDIPVHLWPVSPLSKMWGIGSRLEKRLNALGFFTIGDIAISDPNYLKSQLGVIGEEIYYHSLGYDDALLQDTYVASEHSFSVGQVLLRDYSYSEIPTLIRDMAIEMSDKLYNSKALANNFLLYIGLKDHTGYGKKISFYAPTDSGEQIGKRMVEAFLSEKAKNQLYRQISLVALDVVPIDNYQTSLFEDYEEEKRVRTLEHTLVEIRKQYGTTKALPCSALTLSSTFITRANQIGGHNA